MKEIYRFLRLTKNSEEVFIVEANNEEEAWKAIELSASSRKEYEVEVLKSRPILWTNLTIYK